MLNGQSGHLSLVICLWTPKVFLAAVYSGLSNASIFCCCFYRWKRFLPWHLSIYVNHKTEATLISAPATVTATHFPCFTVPSIECGVLRQWLWITRLNLSCLQGKSWSTVWSASTFSKVQRRHLFARFSFLICCVLTWMTLNELHCLTVSSTAIIIIPDQMFLWLAVWFLKISPFHHCIQYVSVCTALFL